MAGLGRYPQRYAEFDENIWPPGQPCEINETTTITDLSLAQFGTARVSCWTEPQDRRWGKHGSDSEDIVIMKVGMQAQSPEECSLSCFTLDLSFSPITETITTLNPSIQHHSPEEDCKSASVCLIGFPAPKCLQSQTAHERTNVQHNEQLSNSLDGVTANQQRAHSQTLPSRKWRFQSRLIPNEIDGKPSTARWIWELKHEHRHFDGRILHGAVALQHSGQPFLVTCQVMGKISKPGGFRLKFGNKHNMPRRWRIVPAHSELDLQGEVKSLQDYICGLNLALAQGKKLCDVPSVTSTKLIQNCRIFSLQMSIQLARILKVGYMVPQMLVDVLMCIWEIRCTISCSGLLTERRIR